METNYNCDLDCLYCYSYLRQDEQKSPMSLEDACDVIDQGIDLGLRSIVYLGGGEPFLYRHFWSFIEYVNRRKVTAVIFTNGMSIDLSVAKRLFDLGVSIMIKSDGREEIQDRLTGPGTYKRIRSGLDALMEAGFTKLNGRYVRLGIAPCATKVNILEIPEIWRFARKNNIFPNMERATEIGRATSNITLDRSQVRWLTQTLKEIDEKEFGIKWSTPYSAIPAHSCGIFLAGASIMVDRGVALCPEMPAVANLADKPLAEIIQEPPFSTARALEDNIEEPCASCEFFKLCLGGCRSKALVSNKSIFACDPYCTLLAEGQEIAAYFNNFEEPVSSFPPSHIEEELSNELLLITEESPLSCLSVLINGNNGIQQVNNELNRKEIESILKCHLRKNDRIFRFGNHSAYLLTFRNYDSMAAHKLYNRLKSLLDSIDADMQLYSITVSSDYGRLTSEQILSHLNLWSSK